MSSSTNGAQPSLKRSGILGIVLGCIPTAARRRAAVEVRKRLTHRRVLAGFPIIMDPLRCRLRAVVTRRAGWLNSDLGSEFHIDALKRLPFPDNSVDYIYSQHFVEHITRPQACAFFAECRRVLRPTGVLRTSTPNLAYLVHIYCSSPDDMSNPFIRYLAAVELGKEKITRGEYLNASVRTHGHLHIWDFDDLAAALSEAGFTNIQQMPYGESADPELRNLETRYVEPHLVWAQPCDLDVEAR